MDDDGWEGSDRKQPPHPDSSPTKPVNKTGTSDSNLSIIMKTHLKAKRSGSSASHATSASSKGKRLRSQQSKRLRNSLRPAVTGKSAIPRNRKAPVSPRPDPAPMSPASVDGLKSSGAVGGPKPPGEALIPLETLATSRAVPVQVEPEWSETPGPRDSRAVGHPERGVWDEHSSLRLYLRDAVETPLLTAQEEVELARRIQKGDEAAREHMIRANLRLVIKIAREYEDYGLPLLDLVNEGNIGLMRAVERFDPDRGAKLSTYAAWWIKQSIKRALSNQSKSIRLPIHIVQELARMKKAEVRLEADLGRPATDAELAGELEADVDDIRRWREAAAVGATSLDAPIGNDPESNRIADVIADESAVMPWAGVSESSNAELMRELVGSLNPREQIILNQRFALEGGDPRTLEEIGVDFGLTRERIRQLEAAALRKLRDRFLAREAMAEA